MLGEIMHQTRSSLDNLNTLLASRLALGKFDPRRITFPITTDEANWRSWLGNHKMLPGWLTNRYYELQPFVNPYHGLRGLHWANNKDKHESLRSVRVSVTGLLGGGELTVEGLLGEGDPQPVLVAADNMFARGIRRIVVGTIEVGHPVLDTKLGSHNEVEVGLSLDMGYTEYRLEEIPELVRRVGYAVEYAATGDKSELRRYREKPRFADVDDALAQPTQKQEP